MLTEYFVRVTAPNGDDWLVVTSIVEDPVYLNEPFVTQLAFQEGAERFEVRAVAVRARRRRKPLRRRPRHR